MYASASFHCLDQPARHLFEDSHVVVTANIRVKRMTRRLEIWGSTLEGEVQEFKGDAELVVLRD